MSFKLKGRHPISDKERDRINDDVEAWIGIRPLPEEDAMVERARADVYEVALSDGKVFVLVEGHELDRPMPTLRALMANRPEGYWVTVDMGAVPHLRNGADVMSPGITEADPSIEEGDLVWIRDEEHEMPLALGKALIGGDEMAQAESGKAIETLHFVGDEIWTIGTV